MIRTFQTHKVRKYQELTGCLWEFEPCQGEFAGVKYQVATPCCWESHPDFSGYRGEGIYRRDFEGGGNIRLEFKGGQPYGCYFAGWRGNRTALQCIYFFLGYYKKSAGGNPYIGSESG